MYGLYSAWVILTAAAIAILGIWGLINAAVLMPAILMLVLSGLLFFLGFFLIKNQGHGL